LEFEWDPAKAEKNLRKHGIDFVRAEDVFFDTELRSKAVGRIEDGRLVAVIYTMREERIRIISARRARDNERRKYDTSSKTT